MGPGRSIELFEKLSGDADAGIRLLRVDDTAAEPVRSLLDAETTRLPVALIEPLRNGLVQHGEGTYDIRIAVATKMGLPLAWINRTSRGCRLGLRTPPW